MERFLINRQNETGESLLSTVLLSTCGEGGKIEYSINRTTLCLIALLVNIIIYTNNNNAARTLGKAGLARAANVILTTYSLSLAYVIRLSAQNHFHAIIPDAGGGFNNVLERGRDQARATSVRYSAAFIPWLYVTFEGWTHIESLIPDPWIRCAAYSSNDQFRANGKANDSGRTHTSRLLLPSCVSFPPKITVAAIYLSLTLLEGRTHIHSQPAGYETHIIIMQKCPLEKGNTIRSRPPPSGIGAWDNNEGGWRLASTFRLFYSKVMAIFDESSVGFSVLISVVMVITGSLNTLAAKWADSIEVDGVLFDHPFFQVGCMFLGEFSCLVVYLIVYAIRKRHWKKRHEIGDSGAVIELDDELAEEPTLPNFNPFIFLPPACCDVIATSLMYVGLNMTTASSYQMLRGAVIIFTGLLSVAFLRARLQAFKWLGMALVMAGLIVVGVSDIMFDNNPADDINAIITGDLLIIMAQIIVAIQMVTEQKFVLQYDVPPLLAVGLEGLFGLSIISFLMLPMYFIHVPSTFSKNPELRLEDIIFAFKEMHAKPIIAVALLCTAISIAFFNFAGVSVTKRLSATTRMVLDSVRTLVIWMISIPLFGERFIALQLLGFALLILGMFVYNDIFLGPRFRRDILPRMNDSNPMTLCCASFCGADLDIPEHEHHLINENDE